MTTWIDDPAVESDSLTGDYDEEDLAGEIGVSHGGDLDSAEASPFDMRRAQHARRIALARSQAARARQGNMYAPPAPTVSAAVNRTQAAVREVDLKRRVHADAVGSTMHAYRRRLDQTQMAVAATIVERQLETSFPALVENRLVATGLRGAPLLLLRGARRGRGLGGYAADPQALGIALVAGLAVMGEMNRKSQEVSEVRLTRSERELPAKASLRFRAEPVDAKGRSIPSKRSTLTWTPSDPSVATVDANGVVTGLKAGTVTITVSGERSDLFDQTIVTVV